MSGRGGSSKRKRDAARRRPASVAAAKGGKRPKPVKQRARESAPERRALPGGPFRLGAVPGATPGKWIAAWRERQPQVELELVPIAVADQRQALVAPDRDARGVERGADADKPAADAASDPVDAALVRLPIDGDGLHVIRLYDEVTVVVASADSHLLAVDELEFADLAGEIVIIPADDVLGLEIPDAVAPAFRPPETTADAIATVAAGVGVVVVPMSLARLHHRRDVEYRPLRGAAASAVALAWPADRTTPLVETFVGIVRGRTANSSRE